MNQTIYTQLILGMTKHIVPPTTTVTHFWKMARLILQWLNEEVCLSKEITSIADDFRNGFLLGELLSRYNQQQSFESFQNSDTPDAIIQNFLLLEPTMRSIGVHFNIQLVYQIIHGKLGAVKTLLYEIKIILDGLSKVHQQTATEISMNGGGGQPMNKMIKIIRPSLPNYDQTISSTFETALRAMVDNPKNILMSKAIQKFTNLTNEFQNSVSISHSQTMSDMRLQLERTKQISQQRAEQELEFQQTWNLISEQKWKENQTIAKQRKNLIKKVTNEIKLKQTVKREGRKVESIQDALDGIDQFEQRYYEMEAKGLLNQGAGGGGAGGASGGGGGLGNEDSLIKSLSGLEDGTGIPSMSYINQTTLQSNLKASHDLIQFNQMKLSHRTIEHDKRRKRFVRFKESQFSNSLQTQSENEIYESLHLFTSQAEQVEKLQQMRIYLNKNLIIQNSMNRKLIIEHTQQRMRENSEKVLWKETENELKLVIKSRIRSQKLRKEIFKRSKMSAMAQEIKELVWGEIDRMLDLTDWIVRMRELGMYDRHSPFGLQVQEVYQGYPSSSTSGTSTSTSGAASGEDKDKEEIEEERKQELLLPNLLQQDIAALYVCTDVDIPTPLPVPLPTNVNTTLPYSLSWQPLIFDLDSLLSNLFHGENYFQGSPALPSLSTAAPLALDPPPSASGVIAEDCEDDKQEEIISNDISNSSDNLSPSSSDISRGNKSEEVLTKGIILPSPMSLHLAIEDRKRLAESLSSFQPLPEPDPSLESAAPQKKEKDKSQGKDKKKDKKGGAVAEEEESGIKIIPPRWLVNTPAHQLFGDLLVTIRTIAHPIPSPPSAPQHIPQFPLRILLCSPSDAIKRQVAKAIQQEFNVTIISLNFLISQAIQRAQDLDFAAAAHASTAEEGAAGGAGGAAAGAAGGAEYDKLCRGLYKDSLNGKLVSDEDYVALVIHAIVSLDPSSPGYVIEDYPNTLSQIQLLTTALSSLDYTSPCPQRSNYISPYTSTHDYQEEDNIDWDVTQCGLDRAYSLSLPSPLIVQQRIALRHDLRTNEIVSLKDSRDSSSRESRERGKGGQGQGQGLSIETLAEVVTPEEPMDTIALQAMSSEDTLQDIKGFLSRLGIFKEISGKMDLPGEGEGEGEEESECEMMIHDLISDLHLLKQQKQAVVDETVATADLTTLSLSQSQTQPQREEEQDESKLGKSSSGERNDPPLSASASASRPMTAESTSPTSLNSKVQLLEASLSQPLALALSSLWSQTENQFLHSSTQYFYLIREIKYQFLQRKTAIKQLLFCDFMIPDPHRQEMCGAFQKEFNSFENDLRYDSDFISEYLLRILELRSELWDRVEHKMKEISEKVRGIFRENMVSVLVHRVQCEGGAVIQSYCHLFVTLLNILHDAGRSYSSAVNYLKEIEVIPEEMLLPVNPLAPPLSSAEGVTGGAGGGGKGKGKEEKKGGGGAGGKGGAGGGGGGGRSPIAPLLFSQEGMLMIPEPLPSEETETDAKGGAKKAEMKKKVALFTPHLSFPSLPFPSLPFPSLHFSSVVGIKEESV
jgi:hypothetical protein